MHITQLFCLPFAGGSVYSYRMFEEDAPPFIRLATLEYPGRGRRINEPLLPDIDSILRDLYLQVTQQLNQGAYAIYGHSMGGLLAYLLARLLVVNGHPPPRHLFITGTTGPAAPSRGRKRRYLLPREEFFKEIRDLQGSPNEALEHNELLEYFEPILRSDFKAIENYVHHPGEAMDIPFTVITGTEEDMYAEEIQLWQDETRFPVDFIRMEGGHFFIHKHSRELIRLIAGKLLPVARTA